MTYQILLPFCSAFTLSRSYLVGPVCLLVCPDSSNHLCSGCQFCWVGCCWDAEGAAAGCPRNVVGCWDLTKGFLLITEALSNLSILRLTIHPAILALLWLLRKWNYSCLHLQSSFSSNIFFQLLLWSAFRKEHAQQHWQGVLSTGLLLIYFLLLFNAPFLLLYVASLHEHCWSFHGNSNFIRSDCNWKQWDLQM